MEITPVLENYIKTIHLIEQKNKVARIKEIAAAMRVKPPSAVSAVNRLQRMGLARKEHYGTVCLTPEGLAIAEEMENRFELLQLFFSKVLGTDRKTSELDACKIEHIISKQSISRIKKMVLSL